MLRVLVIDDDEVILEACRAILERHGHQVDTEGGAYQGRDRALHGAYDLVLLDLRMPDLDGLQILSTLREHRSDHEVLMITGHATVASAVKAVKLGAFDYLPKPFTPAELMERVEAAAASLHRRRAAATPAGGRTHGLVGESEPMNEIRALIAKVAPLPATVLIVGESGTGKELVASAVHAGSGRRDKPYVSIDCSALAPGLLESELFGHVKGAFTGAVVNKPGLIEIANGGTVFLDEVSNLGLETQGKLLRVLETNEIRPVGGVELKKVDFRLIAATNRDLGDRVKDGAFREDLYYRLAVVPVRLPPLRERPSDIPILIDHFLAQYRRPEVRCPSRVSTEALGTVLRYAWPGNVRELKNFVERMVVTIDEETIRSEHLPAHMQTTDVEEPPLIPLTNQDLKTLKRVMRERSDAQLERIFVIEALRRNDWNVSRAAQETGMLRPNLHALMRKHGIRSGSHE